MPTTCMKFSWEIIISELLESDNYGDIDRDPWACSFKQQSIYIYMNLYLSNAIIFLKYLLLIDIFTSKDVQLNGGKSIQEFYVKHH